MSPHHEQQAGRRASAGKNITQRPENEDEVQTQYMSDLSVDYLPINDLCYCCKG